MLHVDHMLHLLHKSVCECVTYGTYEESLLHVDHTLYLTHEYECVLHAERPAEFFLRRSLGSHVKSKHELSENEIFC